MTFNWDSDTIRWYTEASEYTGFYDRLAELIAPKLAGYETFCDMGCGIGLIDLALSPAIESITCIDINENAIGHLRKSIADRSVTNIHTMLGDCTETSGFWDVIYLCFFGSQSLAEFLPRCKKLIAVVSGQSSAALFPDKYRTIRRNTITGEEEHLKARGIPYSLTLQDFDFGQPFKSFQDAEAFVRSHAPGITRRDLDEFLGESLRETGDTRFPLIIPRVKSVGIFEIENTIATTLYQD